MNPQKILDLLHGEGINGNKLTEGENELIRQASSIIRVEMNKKRF